MGARILCSLFKNDDIPYRLIPVGGLTELEEKSDEALASEEVRITFQDHGLNAHIPKIHTLILLSLGSLLTLTDFFNLPKKIHLHVIDSHRPWNLGNLFDIDLDDEDDEDAHGKVWIWGDGDEFSENMDQLRKSFEALQFLPQKDSDEDSDSDEESEAEEEEPEEEDEDEEGDDDAKDEDGWSRKRRREDSVAARRKRRRDDDRVSCSWSNSQKKSLTMVSAA